ncbi:MAG: dTMP kinase [Pseudomonadota bacterium]
MRGVFITVEGGEGVGKSTNMAYLEQHLRNSGVELTVTREPGGTDLGEGLREVLLKPRDEVVDATAELLLMFAARAQHIAEVIEPSLAAGRWVLCDRFTDATYAYQSGGRRIEPSKVRQLETLVQAGLRPDCTLLFDAPVSLGMARARGRGELDRFEREELGFFERVRDSYLQLARENSDRFYVIDASQTLPDVQARLQEVCLELMARWSAGARGAGAASTGADR